MGDTAVDFFQKTLKELITSSNLGLIIEEKHQLQSLEDEIKYLRGFLNVTEKKRSDHSEVMNLVKQIRDLVAEAENIVELFVVHAFQADHASHSLREHQDHLSLDLESVRKGMKTLTVEMKKIYDENMYNINGVVVKQLKHSSTGSGGGLGSPRGSHASKEVKEEVVLGFEEEVNRLIEKLDDGGEDRPLEIISIIGAGGGGKTTLARKVFDHPFTLYTFEIRAWIDVSQDYDKTRKSDLLIRILKSVIPENYQKSSDDMLGKDILGNYEKNIDKLGEYVLKCLKGKKYLIVMDDVWGIEAWNDIQRSFPKECKGSKVLFTSRLLVQLDSVHYFPYYLAPLPKNWCWELLKEKVFGKKCCPPELVKIGEQIAEKCKGLPLAVVTIAGILATGDKTLNEWKNVAEHLSSIIAKNHEGCMEILELSYNHLPLHLKACFLYIGGYPEDTEIPVRELIWLWIAEGFIQQSEGGESLETIAKHYLISLIDRSLVQVAMKGPLGGIKACRIHDLLRELCLKKVEDDNFLVKVDEDDSFSPLATNKHLRHFFIASKFCTKFSLGPRNLRSFLCVRSQNILLSEDKTNLSFFEENFVLLRVLSSIFVPCIGHIGLGHLVHLRYLSFASLNVLLTPFSYLLNLETLNLDVPYAQDTIPLPRDIFKMVKLRHIYTKRGKFTFHHSSEEAERISFDHSSKLDSLQTLHQVCTCEACPSLLVMTPNLRKLGLYGGLIPKENVVRLPNLECFECLEKLTFSADFAFDWALESTLPLGLKLPQTITRITLKYTSLKWEELSVLQTLPNLEVLRLIVDACRGPVWNTSELDGFPQLKYLKFDDLYIEEWIASEEQFPKLEVLVLQHCRELEQIPIAFGNLNELREIKLTSSKRSAEESASEIQEEQKNRNGDDYCLNLLAKDNKY